jgi:hypothetical protein
MHRRSIALLGGGLVMLVLAGCVGIPTSGRVNDGAIIDAQTNPELLVLPPGPEAGSSQEKILEDFMQAARAPQDGYGVAKQFLTDEFARTWNPDASALIRTGPAITETAGTDSLAYTVASRANVNEQGQYIEESGTSSQTLTFSFQQEDGEWRISAAADGIVLSQASFVQAFREQALYFFDPSYSYLVPDVRWFPSRQTAPVRVVAALLAGPSPWLGQGVVVSAFPEATVLGEERVQSAGSAVVVDLSTEFLSATEQQRDRMRQQLIATLATPNVELSVRGITQTVPESSDRAAINPNVDPAALVGLDDVFGFDGGSGVTPIDGLSAQVVSVGAVGASLTSDKQAAAVLGGGGGVFVARTGDGLTLVDDRPGLVVPSIDAQRFVWSAQASSATSLTTFELDGTEHELLTGLPADNSVASIDVSRDGTRLLLYLSSPVGPRLLVAGIIRQANVPIGLGPTIELAVTDGVPIDATWVDDRSVATLASVDGSGIVTSYELGGPSTPLGQVTDGRAIAGGNSGDDGLRVLSGAGELWRPRGSEGWVNTGISASFLGTKQ